MKVLHFYKTYLPDTIGGVEQVINQIARGTEGMGVTTEVLTLSPNLGDSTIKIDGHLVHRCHTNFEIASTPFSIAAFSQFRRMAQEADLIHYHFPYPFADILHFATRVNKPTLVSYHSDIVQQMRLLKLYKPLRNHFLSSIDHIVAASPNYLESSDVLSRLKYKTSVIPYGLDKVSYPTASENTKALWRERLGPRFFLFIGVIRYYKGLHILVEAARNSHYPVVIGGAGPVEHELKLQAEKLDVQNVYFLGFLSEDDKVALLELCYALVFPSHLRSEAFGISLLEGAMYGKPLISCEIGTGTSFINIDRDTGLVVEPDNSSSFQDAMNYLWDNPKEALAMGRRAELRYWEMFTADQMARSYMGLYKQLLDENV